MNEGTLEKVLNEPSALRDRIQEKIGKLGPPAGLSGQNLKNASVVLFVLTQCAGRRSESRPEPCLILNKRSPQIRQGGDLCCPGGGISWAMDNFLARLLGLLGSPMKRRSARGGRQADQANSRVLNLLLAAGLREAWEEMRLNPLHFKFLGVLPEQHLVMFDRVIYPMVGWASPQPLKPNWEVDRIVPIALRRLLDPDHYGRFRPMVSPSQDDQPQPLRHEDFPCYIHEDNEGREMLWGATFRITLNFLRLVFDFHPPEIENLPLVHRHLDETYLNGSYQGAHPPKRSHQTEG